MKSRCWGDVHMDLYKGNHSGCLLYVLTQVFNLTLNTNNVISRYPMYNILVVEDEKEIREILCKYLVKEGYYAYSENNGIDALAVFHDEQIHLMIVDIMMPGIDGFEVLEEIRKISDIPVIMLTAKQEEVDRLMGFDLGADDYVVKPFSPKEVMKRVGVLIKRIYHEKKPKSIFLNGSLELHLESQKLFKNKKEIPITSMEFDLLKVLFSNIGIVLSRNQLIEKALGQDYEGYDRSIDTYIKRIRQKIEDDSKNPYYLQTRYGAGYVFGGHEDEY